MSDYQTSVFELVHVGLWDSEEAIHELEHLIHIENFKDSYLESPDKILKELRYKEELYLIWDENLYSYSEAIVKEGNDYLTHTANIDYVYSCYYYNGSSSGEECLMNFIKEQNESKN